MDFTAIAALLAQTIPLVVSAIEQLREKDPNVPSVEALLASADGKYDQIIATAKAQLNPPPAQ